MTEQLLNLMFGAFVLVVVTSNLVLMGLLVAMWGKSNE